MLSIFLQSPKLYNCQVRFMHLYCHLYILHLNRCTCTFLSYKASIQFSNTIYLPLPNSHHTELKNVLKIVPHSVHMVTWVLRDGLELLRMSFWRTRASFSAWKNLYLTFHLVQFRGLSESSSCLLICSSHPVVSNRLLRFEWHCSRQKRNGCECYRCTEKSLVTKLPTGEASCNKIKDKRQVLAVTLREIVPSARTRLEIIKLFEGGKVATVSLSINNERKGKNSRTNIAGMNECCWFLRWRCEVFQIFVKLMIHFIY